MNEKEKRELPYDPDLKVAMEKIADICEELDCGGFVTLVSRTHGEFGYILPEWQRLREEVDKDGVVTGMRLLHKKASGHTHEDAELTAHFLHSLRDTAAMAFQFTDKFVEVTDEKWQTEHTPFHNFRPKQKEEEH